MRAELQNFYSLTRWYKNNTAFTLVLILFALVTPAAVATGPAQPNIVVFMTDDQRPDMLFSMPILQSVLTSNAVNFNSAYVTTPWCCPARSSFMSGGFYVHNTQTLTNSDARFRDTNTIATHLWEAGYSTAMVGKYFNGYTNVAPYIPPGWDHFVGVSSLQFTINWNNFEVAIGTTGATSGTGEIFNIQQYITDYEADQAIGFLDTVGDQPFYLYMSFNAPHSPNTPEPEDAELFSDFVYSGRAYNEADLSDKPSWVQENGNCVPAVNSEGHRDALRSLQSVDRAIGEIVAKIEDLGKLDNTVIFFTSDHGTLWGEHRLCHKGHPYEEAIKVPFMVAIPGVTASESDHMISASLDLGPTIYELAGVNSTSDGESLMPLLSNSPGDGSSPIETREHILIQTFKLPTWSGLVVDRADGKWKFVERTTGEFELYNLITDPFELENIANDEANAALVTELTIMLENDRGLSLAFHEMPTAIVGQYYEFQPRAWGGSLPYTWRVAAPSSLPPGLTMDSATGLISGTPTTEGCSLVRFGVTASSTASHYLQLEDSKWNFNFCRLLDTDGDGVSDDIDNCTAVANTDQRDSNSDGFGNVCDADFDNNCEINFQDYALVPPAFLTEVGGPGYDPDIDFNGDGVINFHDVSLFPANFLGPPGPSANECVL